MTGRELCALLQVDYDEIRARRDDDVRANMVYLADRLAEVPELRELLTAKLEGEEESLEGGRYA